MTDNKKLYKKELLNIARHSLEYAAYTHLGSRMFKEKDIEKTLTELEQAAIDFSFAKYTYEMQNYTGEFPIDIAKGDKQLTKLLLNFDKLQKNIYR